MSRKDKTTRAKVFRVRIGGDHETKDEALLNDFLESVEITQITPTLIEGNPYSFWSVFVLYKEFPEKEISPKYMIYDADEPLTPEEDDIFHHLRHWCYQEANKLNVPPYVIFHDAVLKTFVKTYPQTLDELYAVRGIGKRKIDMYGKQILAVLKERGKKEDSSS